MAEIDNQTRVILGEYLAGSLPIDDTRRALARLAWRLSNKEVTEANQTTAAASLFVAEYEAGHRDESELQGLFASLLDVITTNSTSISVDVNFLTVRQPVRSPQLAAAGTAP